MKLLQVQPEFHARDLEQSLSFYRDCLGFRVAYHDEDVHAVLERDGVYLHLDPLGEFFAGSCQFLVDEIDSFYVSICDKVSFQHDIHTPPWGGRSFVVLDPDGNSLCFAQWNEQEN